MTLILHTLTAILALAIGLVLGRLSSGQEDETDSDAPPKTPAEKPSASDATGGMLEQVLQANQALHEQLAQAEARIRKLSAEAKDRDQGATSPGAVDHADIASALSPSALPGDSGVPYTADDELATDEDATEESNNQRTHLRRKLMQQVHLAPFIEGIFPKPDDITAVKGYDISEAGIAFFLSHPPTHDEYVVVLGSVLRPIYMKARVVRVAKKQMYLVGCRFTGRLQPPQSNSSRTRAHAPQATLSVH